MKRSRDASIVSHKGHKQAPVEDDLHAMQEEPKVQGTITRGPRYEHDHFEDKTEANEHTPPIRAPRHCRA